MNKIHKFNPKCKGCGHRRPLNKLRNEYICHYLLDTGKSRGCSVEECPYYTEENFSGKTELLFGSYEII